MSKICSTCKTEKIDSEFYSRGGKQKHLLSSRCKDCYTTPEYREKANARNRKYEGGKRLHLYKKNPLYYLWYIAKKRAKKNGLDFNIIPEDIIYTGFCPVTGQELSVSTNEISTSISLDRVDNTKGYVKGNVVAISRWANLRKSDMSWQDLSNIMNYMERHID